MEAKHTGGEWFARSGLTQLCAKDATTLCQVGPAAADGSFWWVFSTAETHGDAEATARLIAAAPETTEALGRALNELEAALPTLWLAGWDTSPQEEAVRRGRAAILKAAA
jgi:hypothetical protein